MAKIGARIQEIRLKKGLTLERIADDTNISVRFLAKIEADDFTGFPGEPYIVGFIKNYAEYLGLDPEEVVAAYRRKEANASTDREVAAEAGTGKAKHARARPVARLGGDGGERAADDSTPEGAGKAGSSPEGAEAGTPVSEAGGQGVFEDGGFAATATASRPEDSDGPEKAENKAAGPVPGKTRRIVGILLIAVVAAILVWAAFNLKSTGQHASAGNQETKPVEYRVEGTPFEKRLYPGDSLIIPLGDDVFKAELESIGETVNVSTPWGPFRLSLGQPATIDADKDAVPDATIAATDYEKNKPSSGALLRLEIADKESASAPQTEVTVSDSTKPDAQGAEGKTAAPTVLLKSSRGPYPFVVQVSFRGNCMFRYEADRKEWVEKYYFKGESVTVNVNSSLTAWASNAQAAKLVFQASGGKTAELEMGGPGQIAVKKISWSQAEGGWALVATDLD